MTLQLKAGLQSFCRNTITLQPNGTAQWLASRSLLYVVFQKYLTIVILCCIQRCWAPVNFYSVQNVWFFSSVLLNNWWGDGLVHAVQLEKFVSMTQCSLFQMNSNIEFTNPGQALMLSSFMLKNSVNGGHKTSGGTERWAAANISSVCFLLLTLFICCYSISV